MNCGTCLTTKKTDLHLDITTSAQPQSINLIPASNIAMHLSSFLVAALSTAAAAQKVAGSDPSERPLNIQVAVSFPKSAESHPPRLTNDFNNPLNISFTNHESETLTVDFITGSFWRKALPNEKIKGKLVTGDVNVLNLAQQNVNKKVPLGHTHNVIMPAKPWLKAGEVRLELKAVVGLGGNKGRVVVPVFNQTVVVEEKEEKFLLFDLEL